MVRHLVEAPPKPPEKRKVAPAFVEATGRRHDDP
jgi:hypothetical protein